MEVLNLSEMQAIMGGVSRHEYCHTLVEIMQHSKEENDGDNVDRVLRAYNMYCE